MLSRTLPSHGPGGLGAAAWDLARALAGEGARVRLLTTAGATERAAGVEVEALGAPAGRYSRAWWWESRRAYEARAEMVDVVFGVSAAAHALAATRRGRRGRPAFVFQAHGVSAGEIASKLRARRLRSLAGVPRQLGWMAGRDRLYRRYDAVSAVGEAVEGALKAWPTRWLVGATPVHRIANGIDPGLFRFDPVARAALRGRLGLAPGAPLLLFCGRLQADKGPAEALEVLRLLLQRRPDARLALAGDGPEATRLADLARPLADQVIWPGALPREALVPWYSAADVLLAPTRRTEGLPLVVLEALGCGLPVITTPAGAADATLPCRRFHPRDLAGMAQAAAALKPGERTGLLPPAFTLQAAARAHLRLFEALLAARSDAA